MAKFLIGQLVRVAWVHSADFAHEVGLEGRVSCVKSGCMGPTIYGLNNAPIKYRSAADGMHAYGFLEEQLEPILPEGQAPSVYSFQELMDKCREGMAV